MKLPYLLASLLIVAGLGWAEPVEVGTAQGADEAKAAEAVEEADGCPIKPRPYPCGCPPNPECCGPRNNFSNYLDINVGIMENFNFQTSFPDVGTGWGLYNPPGTTYAAGVFASNGDDVHLTNPFPFDVEQGRVTYVTAQASFLNEMTIPTPLGLNTDPFYGSGYIGVFDDMTTGLELAYVLTSNMVYALYARSDALRTPYNNYFAFTYLVPIVSRVSGDHNVYTLSLNQDNNVVTWLVNSIVRMQISRVGQQIDNRFALSNLGGNQPSSIFPTKLKTRFGILTMTEHVTHTACQATVFDYCDKSQNIYAAIHDVCAYAPYPAIPPTGPMTFVMDIFSITDASPLPSACECHPL